MPETQRPDLEISGKTGYDWHIYKGAFQATGTCSDALSETCIVGSTHLQSRLSSRENTGSQTLVPHSSPMFYYHPALQTQS